MNTLNKIVYGLSLMTLVSCTSTKKLVDAFEMGKKEGYQTGLLNSKGLYQIDQDGYDQIDCLVQLVSLLDIDHNNFLSSQYLTEDNITISVKKYQNHISCILVYPEGSMIEAKLENHDQKWYGQAIVREDNGFYCVERTKDIPRIATKLCKSIAEMMITAQEIKKETTPSQESKGKKI